MCVDVDTIYGYHQSRIGLLGPSYKGVRMPLKAQFFYTSQSGWVQIKFFFVAYEMSNTFLDHMQLDLGRYLLPFGRARQMIFLIFSFPNFGPAPCCAPAAITALYVWVPRLKNSFTFLRSTIIYVVHFSFIFKELLPFLSLSTCIVLPVTGRNQ